jgi:alkylation response protein AidB-like acyl-CoA dehydrogenase
MDMVLQPESAELAGTARLLIGRHSGPAPRSTAEPDFDPALWGAAVDAGWPSILASADCGYAELEAAVGLLSEVGRAQALIPLQASMVLGWLAATVPGLAGWHERAARQPGPIGALCWRLAGSPGPAPRLTHSQDGYSVSGDLGAVRDAAVATDLLVAADLGAEPRLVLLPLTPDGVSVVPVESMGGLRRARVRADRVRIPDDRVLPWPGPEGRSRTDALLLILDGAELLGCAQMVLEMTAEHARSRHQFGRPLGAFQAVRHRIADMTCDVEESRCLLYRSAARWASGADATADTRALSLWNSIALERVVASAHQIHGGVGFIRDHPLHRYFGRQKASMFSWGQTADHVDSVIGTLFPGMRTSVS